MEPHVGSVIMDDFGHVGIVTGLDPLVAAWIGTDGTSTPPPTEIYTIYS